MSLHGATTVLPLRPDFEHARAALSGAAEVEGEPLSAGPLLYLGSAATRSPSRATPGPGCC